MSATDGIPATDEQFWDGAGMRRVHEVADAVLYEGYLLYPYRASADKNQIRWQFGVLVPVSLTDKDRGEYASSRTECLAEPTHDAVLRIRLRFLHLQARTVLVSAGGRTEPVAALLVDGEAVRSWDEAVAAHVDVSVPVGDALACPCTVSFTVPGAEESEAVVDGSGREVASLLRRRWPLRGEVLVEAQPLAGPYGGMRLCIEVRNTTDPRLETPSRPLALRHSMISAHTLLALSGGGFLSLTDPPQWAASAAAACVNERTWPVLVGAEDGREVMLSSPIILYDHPSVAAESPTALYDGTEIDEILTLRTMALTEAEKREVRATDPRAAQLLDAVDGMPPELLDRLHGTVRYLRDVTGAAASKDQALATPWEAPPWEAQPWWDPAADSSVDPETDSVLVNGTEVTRGGRVRLRPRPGADAQDMFLDGMDATVQAVLSDVDGNCHVAVTLDGDPAADLQAAHGRYRYFGLDEVLPLPDRAGAQT